MLYDLIKRVPDEDAVLSFLNKFDKLIRKYARILRYEDAYSDLILFFIELLNKLKYKEFSSHSDGVIVNYINSSIKNYYIFLSKRMESESAICFSDINEAQLSILFNNMSYEENPISLDMQISNVGLTDYEYAIVTAIYEEGKSVSSLAKKHSVTRQAINQTKIRALEKLKKHFNL